MNASALSLIIAAISVAVAAFYSILTFRILRANQRVTMLMEQQLEASTRPYISVDALAFGSPLLSLRVRNLGSSAATNLRLRIDRDFYRLNRKLEENNLRTAPAFSTPIPSFAPRAELVFDIGVYHQIVKEPELTPTEFKITAEYEYAGKKTSETTAIDLNMFRYSVAHPERLIQELQKIRNVLEKSPIK